MTATPLLAQESSVSADPLAAEPAASEPAANAPAPAAEVETVTTTEVTETSSSPEAAPVVRKTTRTVSRAPSKAAAPTARSAASTPASTSASAEPLPADPAVALTPTEAAPAAPLAPETDSPPPATAADSSIVPIDGETAQHAFGGALAALLLGGAALAARRRRRRNEEWVADDVAYEGVQPAQARPATPVTSSMAASPQRSAFAWGNPVEPSVSSAPKHDRMSPTAVAKMGPTPENPSMSLKKRLKRAAFFEDRERAAATGDAVPVSRTAGLPKTAVEMMREAMAPVSQPRVFQPA